MRKQIHPRLCVVWCLTSFSLALVVSLLSFNPLIKTGAEEVNTPEDLQKEKERVWAAIAKEDEAGFQRLGAPKPGEWLTQYKESPQPFERYKLSNVTRPSIERRTLVLQPLGAFNAEQQQMLKALKEYAEVFFQLPTRIEQPIELPMKDPEADAAIMRKVPMGTRRGTYDRQYDAEKILETVLRPVLPDDAAAYLGITMQDLYVADLNYVFGLGSFKKRVGVYSLVRYFPEFWGRERKAGDETLALLRACKVLNHETGHMFGLAHCLYYKCSMNGSNSLNEADAAPVHFCPVCHRKLQWNIGFNTVQHYKQVGAFYDKNGLNDEAAWTSERLVSLRKLALTEAAAKDE